MDFMTRRLYQLQECVISWHWVRDFWKAWWPRPFLPSMWSQTSSIGITYEFAQNAGFRAHIPCPLPSYWIRTCVLLRSPDGSCEQLWSSLCPTELSQLLGSLWPISFFAVLWEIDGETVETVSDFNFLGSKITAAMKLKDAYSLEGKLWPT